MKMTISLICILFSGYVNAQSWIYKFSKLKDTINSLEAFTTDTSVFSDVPAGGGTYSIRIGSAGGEVTFKKGNSKGELQLYGSSNNFTNKFTVSDWNEASPSFYIKCRIKTSSPSAASFIIAIGKSTHNNIFRNDYCHTGGYGCCLAMLRIKYAEGGSNIIAERRNKDKFTAIANSQLVPDTYQYIEFYVNNTNNTKGYSHNEVYSLKKQCWDIWINGVKISPEGGYKKSVSESDISLEPGELINGIAFFAENNGQNNASLSIDEITYSSNFPSQESPIVFGNTKETKQDAFVYLKR